MGMACSECFSGPNLARILMPGFEYEQQAMRDLANGDFAATLSNHTSGGVTPALQDFLDALEPHLPWKGEVLDDYCVSLQLEGASAVWAAIDMLLQVQMFTSGNADRKKVAVATTSYHGPPSTSFGARCPLWGKPFQVLYPVPVPGMEIDEDKLIDELHDFLFKFGSEIGVMLMEPQWGSSVAALPWPQTLLKKYIQAAQGHGIKVICDEIMCGLGRHGKGTLFVSEAWELNPDAVTFGKAIGGGVYPLSGAVIKKGRNILTDNKCSVMQSHTYAGASTRALMTATEVLNELPKWFDSIAKLGDEMEHIFRYITKMADGLILCHGQGLMWGGIITIEGKCRDSKYRAHVVATFKRLCDEVGVLPYHVPVGGFMVSPVIDIDVGTVYEMGERLEKVIRMTMREVDWDGSDAETASLSSFGSFSSFNFEEIAAQIEKTDKCLPALHRSRSCTSCADFVCRDVRKHFLHL